MTAGLHGPAARPKLAAPALVGAGLGPPALVPGETYATEGAAGGLAVQSGCGQPHRQTQASSLTVAGRC
jgi:hypothetical protein